MECEKNNHTIFIILLLIYNLIEVKINKHIIEDRAFKLKK